MDFLGSNHSNTKFSSRNSKFSNFDTLAFCSSIRSSNLQINLQRRQWLKNWKFFTVNACFRITYIILLLTYNLCFRKSYMLYISIRTPVLGKFPIKYFSIPAGSSPIWNTCKLFRDLQQNLCLTEVLIGLHIFRQKCLAGKVLVRTVVGFKNFCVTGIFRLGNVSRWASKGALWLVNAQRARYKLMLYSENLRSKRFL